MFRKPKVIEFTAPQVQLCQETLDEMDKLIEVLKSMEVTLLEMAKRSVNSR